MPALVHERGRASLIHRRRARKRVHQPEIAAFVRGIITGGDGQASFTRRVRSGICLARTHRDLGHAAGIHAHAPCVDRAVRARSGRNHIHGSRQPRRHRGERRDRNGSRLVWTQRPGRISVGATDGSTSTTN